MTSDWPVAPYRRTHSRMAHGKAVGSSQGRNKGIPADYCNPPARPAGSFRDQVYMPHGRPSCCCRAGDSLRINTTTSLLETRALQTTTGPPPGLSVPLHRLLPALLRCVAANFRHPRIDILSVLLGRKRKPKASRIIDLSILSRLLHLAVVPLNTLAVLCPVHVSTPPSICTSQGHCRFSNVS